MQIMVKRYQRCSYQGWGTFPVILAKIGISELKTESSVRPVQKEDSKEAG
jgi:hypothetical protein